MRYPDAIWRPTDKHGYPNSDAHLQNGVVIHSMEGSLQAGFGVLDGPRQASWHFSVSKTGEVYQHVDTDNIAWTNGGFDANRLFWGIECEGVEGESLTEPQFDALMGVLRWLWDVHDVDVAVRRETLWEHNEMTQFGSAATSCPSGRIPWERVISSLEDDMPSQAEWDAMKVWQREHSVLFRDAATTAAILIQGATHRLVDDPEVVATLGYANAAYLSVPHSYIMDRAPHNGGSLTLAEAEAIVNPSPGGASDAQMRGIAKDEIDLAQVKAAR